MVNYLDDVVSELVKALKAKGLWDNLLFIASSDNGGPVNTGKGGNNFPLKGGKHSDWQGGVRVNAFASGGFLPQAMRGQKTEGYIHIADWPSMLHFVHLLVLIQLTSKLKKLISHLLIVSICGH